MANSEDPRSHLEELIRDAEAGERQTTEHAEYVQAAREEFAAAGFDLEAVPVQAIAMRAHELLAAEEDEIIDELDEQGRLGA